MSGRTFVDTNVLVYAHDMDAGAKRQIAREILLELWAERTGALSIQVLQEFYVSVTRKIPSPLPRASARLVVDGYATWCAETTPAEIVAAFRIEDEARISFWDALIGATRILSEDLNAGQRINGILVDNPFAASQ